VRFVSFKSTSIYTELNSLGLTRYRKMYTEIDPHGARPQTIRFQPAGIGNEVPLLNLIAR
jgi:hypothetical protein